MATVSIGSASVSEHGLSNAHATSLGFPITIQQMPGTNGLNSISGVELTYRIITNPYQSPDFALPFNAHTADDYDFLNVDPVTGAVQNT